MMVLLAIHYDREGAPQPFLLERIRDQGLVPTVQLFHRTPPCLLFCGKSPRTATRDYPRIFRCNFFTCVWTTRSMVLWVATATSRASSVGIPFYTAKERAERLREAAALIRLLWTETSASFTGKYYQLNNAPFAPKPLQKPYPPILIGGAGRKLILPTVARYANIWNVGFRTPAAVAELNKALDRYCQEIGRNPKEIERSLYMPLVLTTSSMRSWVGSWMMSAYKWYGALSTRTWPQPDINYIILGTPDQVTEQIRQYRDAGITTFIFGVAPELGDPHETLHLLATEVMPAFR